MGITGPILLGQYMTPRFLMCPVSTNILMILANFADTIILFLFTKNIGHDCDNTNLECETRGKPDVFSGQGFNFSV